MADDADQRVVVVLGIRGDFYGRCAEYPELSARIGANTVLVGPMRRDELRRAIELPASRAGLRVEPRLVMALVGDVADEPGGLPLLSTTLVELWEKRSGRTLRRSSYQESGGVSGAVARLAERAYDRMSAPQRERTRAILLRLTDADQPEPVRRRVPLAELEAEHDTDTAAALAALTESRLVTVDEGAVEVAHEALLREWPRLRGWLDEDIEGRRLHQHLIHAAAEWQGSASDPAELYRGARLASALDWAAGHGNELNEVERAFLEASEEASEREAGRQRRTNRRLRALLVGAAVLLAAAVVAGLFAISERQSARDAARVEAAQRLGAQALNEERIDQALRLAGAGVALDDTVDTRGNLLAALLRAPPAALGLLGGSGDAPIYGLAVSPDGHLLAAGDGAGTVTVFDAASRDVVGQYQLGDAPGGGLVQTLTFSPDGGTLAVTGQEPTDEPPGSLVDLVDTGSWERRVRVVLPRFPDPAPVAFASAAFLPNGRDLVVMQTHPAYPGGPASVLRTIDGSSGELEGAPLRVGRHAAFGLSATADRRHVFVTTEGEDTYEIDARGLRVVRRYPAGGAAGALSPDGTTFAIGSEDGSVRLLDVDSGRVKRLAGGHDAGVRTLAFTPDGRRLLTADDADEDQAGEVIVWDVGKGERIEELSMHQGGIPGLVPSPDGRTLYSGATDSRLILWDLSGDRRLVRSFPADPRFAITDTPRGIAVSPDGQTLALTHSSGAVDLIDTDTLRRRDRVHALDGFAAAVGFSPDGRLLAVAGEDGQVRLWDTETLAPAGRLSGLPADSQALAFSPDDEMIAAATNTAPPVLRVWDVGRRALAFESKTVAASLAFSPDGELLAAAALERGTEIRDANSGKLVERLPTDGLSRSVTFSPDGSLLAVGQFDGDGRLYSTDDWQPLGSPLEGHTERITYVDFSPDGRTLATASADGTVKLWNVETQQPIGPGLTVAPRTFTAAAFSPTGPHLFAVPPSGPGIRFDTDPRAWIAHACMVGDGGLTREQWQELVPEQEYVEVCPPA